jgi:large subunit ribosomal protein L10
MGRRPEKLAGGGSARSTSPRPEKIAAVAAVRERLTSSRGALLTEYRGLDVAAMAGLRRSLREADGEYKVYKNTLVRFAVREAGLEGLEAMLEGPTAIAFADGELSDVARVLRDFSRSHPGLVVKGGLLGGDLVTAAEADTMASLPPRDVLLAQVAGALAAPLSKLAALLEALPRNLAYGLAALVDQRGEKSQAPEASAPSEGGPGTTEAE